MDRTDYGKDSSGVIERFQHPQNIEMLFLRPYLHLIHFEYLKGQVKDNQKMPKINSFPEYETDIIRSKQISNSNFIRGHLPT